MTDVPTYKIIKSVNEHIESNEHKRNYATYNNLKTMLKNNDEEQFKKLVTYNLISEVFKCMKTNSGALAYEKLI
jgi:hypothetical protein